MHTIQQADHTAHKPVAQTSLRRHCSIFSTFADTRANDKVRAPFTNSSQHQGQVRGIITPISVHKHHYLSTQAIRRFEALQAGSSITTHGFAGNDCSRPLSYNCCSIRTAIINYNNPLCEVLWKFCKQVVEGY